jgi:hypothetical protein
MDPIAKATELLQAADACHDDDPVQAAGLLRQIDADALNPAQRPRFAYLLNHVLGEKQGLHAEVWLRQQAVLAACRDEVTLPVLRHAGAAARLAGDLGGADHVAARLAGIAQVDRAMAADLLQLTAASFEVPRLEGEAAARAALTALALLTQPTWRTANALDAAAAAMVNNIASNLVERPLPELSIPSLRQAMAQGAELAQELWHRGGQWVQHERAHYLRALAANALGDAATAEAQARAGLVLLANFDSAGNEKVDEAFLRSELAHALVQLGRPADAQVERTLADATIEALADAGISEWYRSTVARQQALAASDSSTRSG